MWPLSESYIERKHFKDWCFLINHPHTLLNHWPIFTQKRHIHRFCNVAINCRHWEFRVNCVYLWKITLSIWIDSFDMSIPIRFLRKNLFTIKAYFIINFLLSQGLAFSFDVLRDATFVIWCHRAMGNDTFLLLHWRQGFKVDFFSLLENGQTFFHDDLYYFDWRIFSRILHWDIWHGCVSFFDNLQSQ